MAEKVALEKKATDTLVAAVSEKGEAKPMGQKKPAAEAKKPAAEVKKPAQAQKKEPAVVKKKFIQYIKKENKKKSKEAYENQKKLKKKKRIPTFRGRFGKKQFRRKSIAKWDKWRKPHGIDLDKGMEHGFRPKAGYRNSRETRFLHPSGYREVLVCNLNDLERINPQIEAARLSASLGKRKRNEIVAKANQKGVWVLN